MPTVPPLVVRELGTVDCGQAYAAMRAAVQERIDGAARPDELWLLEHPAVYTCGLSTRPEQVPPAGPVPVLRLDRGGQVTYHGPGQWIVYLLLDLERRRLAVRTLVRLLEQSVIDFLAAHHQLARRREGAPGVYVDAGKIASVGLRVRRGYTYHGISLNADVDLAPFDHIAVCGVQGQPVARLADLGIHARPQDWVQRLQALLDGAPENQT